MLTFLATVGIAFAVRYLPVTNLAVFLLAALSPYLLLSGFLAAIVAAICRRWIWVAVAVTVSVVAVAVYVLPFSSSPKPQVGATSLRVMTVNLMKGQAAALNLVGLAAQNADVLAVQELTSAAIGQYRRAGIDRSFPYQALDPRPEINGVGIWSRYPITRLAGENDDRMSSISARVDVPGVPGGVTVVSMRIPNPLSSSTEDWRDGIGRVRDDLTRLAEQPGCVITAGDFNSTVDMRDFRALLDIGFREARQGSDHLRTPTFPSVWRLPPLFAVDHIFTHGCTAEGAYTIAIPISDHRALAAKVVLPG